jgi:hypothetical protein
MSEQQEKWLAGEIARLVDGHVHGVSYACTDPHDDGNMPNTVWVQMEDGSEFEATVIRTREANAL